MPKALENLINMSYKYIFMLLKVFMSLERNTLVIIFFPSYFYLKEIFFIRMIIIGVTCIQKMKNYQFILNLYCVTVN